MRGQLYCYPAQENFFAAQSASNDESIESQIANALWCWKLAAPDDRDSILTDQKLALMLEFWFPFSDIELTRKLGIWCDGLPILEIKSLGRVSFQIAGVGYFPHDFAPFELEFHFNNRRDPKPRSIIFRFGLLDHDGGFRMIGHNKHPSYTMGLRPKTNSDWAVAVELTDGESVVAG